MNSINVIATIKENKSGKQVSFGDEIFIDEDGIPFLFVWTDGNFSCDCNRHMFFKQALGEEEDYNFPCSHGLYSVKISDGETGEIYLDEIIEKP